jgi:hypothetical protein
MPFSLLFLGEGREAIKSQKTNPKIQFQKILDNNLLFGFWDLLFDF